MSFKNILVIGILTLSSTTTRAKVYLVKHWHLSPGTVTYPTAKTPAPQTDHFKDTVSRVEPLLKEKKDTPVWVEGCEGEMNGATPLEFKSQFNGWSLAEAQKNISTFPMTHIGFLIESKFQKEAKVECVDDLKTHTDSLKTLSDLRAITGYMTRVQEFKNDPKKLKIYLDGVIEMYALPKNASTSTALSSLKKDLKQTLTRFEQQIETRNEAIISRAKKLNPETDLIIIYGGLHIPMIEKSLKKIGLKTEVITPKDYPEDGDLIEKMRTTSNSK